MKLLIVDDELHIRTGLQKAISWDEIGIEETFTASDGEEAIALFRQYRPELVITDIIMPFVDGIQLTEMLLAIRKETKIIVFSGHSEFAYAQQALKLGVFGYELKPVSIPLLINQVKSAIEQYKLEQDKTEAYKQHKFMQLIKGEPHALEEAADTFSQLFSFPIRERLLLMAMEIDEFYKRTDSLSSGETERLEAGLVGIVRPRLADMNGMLCHVSENLFVIIVQVESRTSDIYLWKKLEQFHREASGQMWAVERSTLSCGVSSIGGLTDISDLYKEAEQALDYKFYIGKSKLIHYKQVVRTQDIGFLPIEEADLREYVEQLNMDKISEWLTDQYDRFHRDNQFSRTSIEQISLYYVMLLIRIVNDKYKYFEKMLLETIHAFDQANRLETVEEYREQVLQVYRQVIEGIVELKGIRQNRVLIQAIEYIHDHYMEDLSIDLMARQVNKTPNYFSHLFKKEYGTSFSEYLNKHRIQKAKELLTSTDRMIYEIAESVGYKDYKHFAHVFKKLEGCTPFEFRNNKNE